MNDFKAEQLGNTWLRSNGITQKQFNQAEIWQLQAQKTAHNLLKNKADLLTDEQIQKLMTFCHQMGNSKKRTNVTKRMTYEVMNIGTKIKRNGFKAKTSR
jgi:hypothetical protein